MFYESYRYNRKLVALSGEEHGRRERGGCLRGLPGFYGDRCYAFRNSAARKGFPYLNANVQQHMLLYRPKFRFPARAARPPNPVEATGIAPGVNPTDAKPEDMALDVVTPSGGVVDDPH